jgi:hypothetical protein
MANLLAAIIVAVGLGVMALVPASLSTQIATHTKLDVERQQIVATKVQRETVGRITGMVDCQWIGSDEKASNGDRVAFGGKYSLASGVLEVTYDTGAKVILQGPVNYTVDSENGGFVSHGKMTGTIEHSKAKGFVVRTPTAVITDLGTEFGVEVSEEGSTTSHVFRGSVDVKPIATKGQPKGRSIRLVANESARVKRAKGNQVAEAVRIAVDPATYIRSEQISNRAIAEKATAFGRWQVYRDDVCKDPSLLAYYDFQKDAATPSVLHNVAANGHGSYDGIIENARWTTGRMPGKQALLFNGRHDFVQIHLPQTVDSLTLAAWIDVYSLHNSLLGLVMSDQWGHNGQLHWQLRADGRIGVCIFPADGFFVLGGEAFGIFDVQQLHRWTHLAMVYDHAAEQLCLYVNGAVTDKWQIAKHVPICIGPARIGHWNYSQYPTTRDPDRNFTGRIDELAIFARPLKTIEVERMFEAGKPADGHTSAQDGLDSRYARPTQ